MSVYLGCCCVYLCVDVLYICEVVIVVVVAGLVGVWRIRWRVWCCMYGMRAYVGSATRSEKGCVQETNTTTSTTLVLYAMYYSKKVTVLQ